MSEISRLEMLDQGFEIGGNAASNQARVVLERIISETGVTNEEVLSKILTMRPDGFPVDLHMTNGILREQTGSEVRSGSPSVFAGRLPSSSPGWSVDRVEKERRLA